MTNIAILGGQFGDEGKGKITHYFSKDYNWVIRFNGGANAGHTIYRSDYDGRNRVKYVHNLLPSFDWRKPDIKCFMAQGMVIDLEKLYEEIMAVENDTLKICGYKIASRIYIDPDAFAVLLEHKEEDVLMNSHIGSTNRGIGPAYKSKISRNGTRIKNLLLNDKWAIKLQEIGVQFKHVLELKREFSNSNLLFEGAQGIMLDINHGTYPFVSCSDSTVSGIGASGFNFIKLDNVYGVAKCYLTRVGEGPFPTELYGKEAEHLRKIGNEYGATTGRPRRIGWFDLPAIKYACDKGGINNLIITKLDILNCMEYINFCVAYDKMPVCPSDFFDAKIQLIKMRGWKDSKNSNEIAPFLDYISNFSGCPVKYISAGIDDCDIFKW